MCMLGVIIVQSSFPSFNTQLLHSTLPDAVIADGFSVKMSNLFYYFLFFHSDSIYTTDRFNGIDDVHENGLLGLPYSTFQQILGNSSRLLNPIDRLYSMQNYYFECSSRTASDAGDGCGI